MKLKKKIWIPITIGMVSAILILAASEANFSIPLGNEARHPARQKEGIGRKIVR